MWSDMVEGRKVVGEWSVRGNGRDRIGFYL